MQRINQQDRITRMCFSGGLQKNSMNSMNFEEKSNLSNSKSFVENVHNVHFSPFPFTITTHIFSFWQIMNARAHLNGTMECWCTSLSE